MVLLGPFDRAGLAALAPWLGTYALSGLVVLIAALVWPRWPPRARGGAHCAVVALVAVGMYLPGPAERERHASRFTLVQPDSARTSSTTRSSYEGQFRAACADSRRRGATAAERLVLWPESGAARLPARRLSAALLSTRTTAGADPALARAADRAGRSARAACC